MKNTGSIKKEISSIKKMFGFVYKIGKKECFFVILICAFTSFMYPLLLEFNYRIISAVETDFNGDFKTVILLIFATIAASAIFRITKYSNLLLFEKMQIKVGTSLMNKVYSAVGTLEHSYFDSPDNIAELKRKVLFSQDSMLTQNVVHAVSLICNAVSLLLIFPVVYRAGAEVFIMIFAVAVASNLFEFDEGYLRWEHRKKQEKDYNKRDKTEWYFFDKASVAEMRMIKSDGFIQKKWENLNEEIYKEDYCFEKKLDNRKLLFDIFRIVLNALPLLYVSWKFGTGSVDIATVFVVWQTQGQFNGIMTSVFSEFKAVHYSVPYIDELCEFTEQSKKPEIPDTVKSDAIIELKNVDFSYANGNRVLKNINLKIFAGEKIAVIGPNGAGKTTLVKLLAGLYNATSGEAIYGLDKTEIGAVWQDYVKFELSLRESIGLGDCPQMQNTEELLNVCSMVGIDSEEIKLSDIIGRAFDSDGKIPSGGQWQKIAIARAVFGDKSFLYMDEPTASLDPISEVNLYSEIKSAFKDKTVIFVSHRVGFANLAERILYVNNGEITEDGSHDELMRKRGFYYKFYTEQLKWYDGMKEA